MSDAPSTTTTDPGPSRADEGGAPRERGMGRETAFDRLAHGYDSGFSDSRLGRLLRTRVHERLLAVLPHSARVLELGCGTGEDAAFLAEHGHRVLATDASKAMLEIARQKLGTRGVSDRVRLRECRLEDLAAGGEVPDAETEGPFDAVLANFGVLNCTNRWSAIASALTSLVRPEGRCVLVLMGRYCPWEWLWYGLRGRLPTALRRLSGRAVARIEGGPELTIHYPTPNRLTAAFEPAFRRVELEGLGSVLPPSYGRTLIANAPEWAQRIDRWDRLIGRTTVGSWLSDHYLIELERTTERAERNEPTTRTFRPAPRPRSRSENRSERVDIPPLACPDCGRTLPTPELGKNDASTPIVPSGTPIDPRHPPNPAWCAHCATTYPRTDGMWRLLTADRESEVRPFLEQYETIRTAEGRGSDDPAFYRALPFEDRTGRFAEDWRVRAESFRTFRARILAPLESRHDRPLRVLDLGAGNGWLSNRIARRGHRPVALDLRVDDRDGLGAGRHYETDFPAVQADFRELPFPDRSFDLAVFNASLHYAPDVNRAVQEAARVLRREGRLAVVDTPLYRDPASGRQMVREREDAFEEAYGFRSDALESANFLTWEGLGEIAASAALTATVHRPSRNWRRRLGPLTAWIRGTREPARLPVIELREETARPTSTRDRVGEEAGRLAARAGRTGWRIRRQIERLLGVDRERSYAIETISGRRFEIFPDVFNPVLLRTGRFLGEAVAASPPASDERVLDMGCGSGVGAVAAARDGASVDAVDVNPEAVACTRRNVSRNGCAQQVRVLEGDLFGPVTDRSYDLVLFNPPFLEGRAESAYERAWRSEGLLERFAEELGDHLRPGGKAFLVLSTDADVPSILRAFWTRGYRSRIADRRSFLTETLRLYELVPLRPARS